MADNISISEGAGKTIATEDVSDVQHQKVKIEFGTDGVATMVSSSDPLPVGGTVTANAGTNLNTSALATEAGNLASIKAKTDNIPALGQALASASVPVILPSATITTLTPPAAITGFALAANQLPDGHNVTINNSTGASAVNIQDGGNTITVDGTVAVTNAGITTIAGAVTGTEMQVDVLTMPTVTVNAHAVTNAGTFAVQATEADGANVTLGAKADARSTATDTTAITAMQVLKEISYMEQNPASRAVTNAGTFATQSTLAAETTKVIGTINVAASQTIGVTQATAGNLNCTEASASAIKTAVEALDNSVDGNYLNTNLNYAGTDAVTGNGTAAGSLRVSLASDSTGIVSLTTSTASIGKLAANSGIDIGDVDVTSVPRSLSGPAQPGTAIDSYTHAAINLASGANQVLVSSAANKQIWVYGITYVVNAAGTVSFQDEDDTAISGIMPHAANSGLGISPSGNFSMPIWKLATDKDLEVDVVTSEIDGWIDYAIISV